MRLELAERLRCPQPHAPSPMILVARTKRDRELIEGVAGCPVCHLEITIGDGNARFAGAAAPMPPGEPSNAERVMALLGLAEPGGSVLLTGRYAAIAEELRIIAEVDVLLAHAPEPRESDGVSALLGAPMHVPFTDGTFRGAVLDVSVPDAFAADAVRAVVPNGRVLAAVPRALPHGLQELARDETEWVAERATVSSIVELKRRG